MADNFVSTSIFAKYGILPNEVRLWGTGKPLREFLWSEEMADASVYVLEHVDFKDTYQAGSREVRNCHINIGTGKEITIAALAQLIVEEVGWADEGVEPNHMIILFMSSCGKAFYGGVGNTLWIDNVKLLM